ncbi:MAG: PGPGW domain-containing protein [bacterium]|nr:PGPGW domain-containing protein [bacterium]MDZ4247948.1 PGPGW domain-containing protein [Patescibacteria group bacterium]
MAHAPKRGSRFALVKRLRDNRHNHRQRHKAIRGLTIAAGVVVVVAGLLMLVLPGPGLAVILVGLYLLALEFHWAERLLGVALEHADRAKDSSFSKAVVRFVKTHPRLSALLFALFLTLAAAFVFSIFALDLV